MAVQTYSLKAPVFSVIDPMDNCPFVETIEPFPVIFHEISHSGLQFALHLISGTVLPTSM